MLIKRCVFPLLVFGFIVAAKPVSAETEGSTWITTAGPWTNPLNWDGPVPVNAGDIATLVGTENSLFTVTLPSQVILGKLYLSGAPTFRLVGTGPLVFDDPGAAPALLSIVAL